MTLQEARNKAIQQSKDGCVQHVNAQIAYVKGGDYYYVTPNGFFVSDWFDGSTVESYAGGELQQ